MVTVLSWVGVVALACAVVLGASGLVLAAIARSRGFRIIVPAVRGALGVVIAAALAVAVLAGGRVPAWVVPITVLLGGAGGAFLAIEVARRMPHDADADATADTARGAQPSSRQR
ncbi:hypothetical protein [Demequina mangrovi]|uniref:Uncharacterized protein n=1 Tax=Demequina mangrovi TaxID=1043493 RepID=A0A1H6ZA37_9MICO|nr:hypothetical protein [Demequina mangrovi]SEJ45725.1 hypothetical protein SAMN05421637_1843 [Demequina mangrovi]